MNDFAYPPASNDFFANPMSIAESFRLGLMDETDLLTLAEATQDLYAADGFFGFDPYGGKAPEELTIRIQEGFLPPVPAQAHYELCFPIRSMANGVTRQVAGPPQRVLVVGAAPNAVELSWTANTGFGTDK